MDKTIHSWPEHRVVLFQSGGECSRECYTVIGAFASDHFVLARLALALPVIAGGLEGRIICLRSTRCKHRGVQAFIGETCQLIRQLDRGKVGHTGEAGGERQLFHLVIGCPGKLLAAVPGIDIPQSRHPIQDLLPIRRIQPDPFPALDHQRVGMGFGMVCGV